MKRVSTILTAVLLIAAVLLCGTACGKVSESTNNSAAETVSETKAAETGRRMIINGEPVVITAKDGFDNAGVTELICDATETYSFTKSDDSTTWKVFVLDERFADGARYLAQAYSPALEGDGTLTIEEGKYIYILCSESVFTGESASEASLSIDYAGVN